MNIIINIVSPLIQVFDAIKNAMPHPVVVSDIGQVVEPVDTDGRRLGQVLEVQVLRDPRAVDVHEHHAPAVVRNKHLLTTYVNSDA